MKKTLLAFALIGSLSSVSAHNTGHWTNAAGEQIKTASGDCVLTISSEGGSCDGSAAGKTMKAKPSAKETMPKTDAKVAAPADAAPVKLKSISLSSGAAFASGSSKLSGAGNDELAKLAAELKGLDSLSKVTIEGHTDSSGSEAFNQRLSQERADAVKTYLVDNGIPAEKIEAIGYGESQPIADNATSAGKAKNRRVTIQVDGNKTIQQ